MSDILVVEDNLEMGTLLCDFLKAEGYSVEHCLDGADAMDMFVESGAKLVILDIMLPHSLRVHSEIPGRGEPLAAPGAGAPGGAQWRAVHLLAMV